MKHNSLKDWIIVALADINFTSVAVTKEAFIEAVLKPGKLSNNLNINPTKATFILKKLFPDRGSKQSIIPYILRRIGKKYCNKCSTVKDLEYFGKNTSNRDGHMGSCKACHNIEQQSYYYRNPEAQVSRVRKRDRQLDRALTQSELLAIFTKYDNKCAICGYLNEDHNIDYGQNLHLDHIIPVSKGGKTEINNIQLLCISCNCSKGSRV